MKRLFIIGLVLLLSTAIVIAQEDSCVVTQALSSTAENCSDVAQGEACLGYTPVKAVVNCEDAPDINSAGDTVPLDVTCSMQVGDMESPEDWGVAVMKIPVTDTDLSATYVLLGDVWIKNAGSSFSEIDGQIINDTDVYSGPGSDYDVVGSMTVGEETVANACNCTGNWVRIRLESGEIGWIAARNIELEGDNADLPGVGNTTPVYEAMQAFEFDTGENDVPCDDAPPNGILIQVPDAVDSTEFKINGVVIQMASTVFIQSGADGNMIVEVLDGEATIIVDSFTVVISAGGRVVIPVLDYLPTGIPQIEPYAVEDVANLPLDLLPEVIDPTAPFEDPNPIIIGVEPCSVQSNMGETVCGLHFLNIDGLPITQMDVKFVDAPYGNWVGSVHENPELLSGDYVSGTLAWGSTCSLDESVCFLGPVVWEITITDEAGHMSEPFLAQFNCVSG